MAGGISRRAVVSGGAIAVTLSAVPALGMLPALGALSPSGTQSPSGTLARLASRRTGLATHDATAELTWARSRFTPFVGAMFRMTDGTDAAAVVLTDVQDLHPVRRTGDEKRFALLFAAAPHQAPADGIRTFRNAEFGEIDMFVSPAGQRHGPLRYQVIIDRL